MFIDEIRRAMAVSPRAELPKIAALLWKAFAAGHIEEAEAQALAELIHARQALGSPEKPQEGPFRRSSVYPPRRLQRPPRRPEAILRRRRLAASGPLPPQLAAQFTTGELSVLRIVGDHCRDRGACDRSLAEIAARAGVCRKLAQSTIRKARFAGLLKVEERRRPGRPNLTNVLTVVSREWRAWMARGPRKPAQLEQVSFSGGGGKKIAPTDTGQKRATKLEQAEPDRPVRIAARFAADRS